MTLRDSLAAALAREGRAAAERETFTLVERQMRDDAEPHPADIGRDAENLEDFS